MEANCKMVCCCVGMLLITFGVAACVNQAATADPYRLLTVSGDQMAAARAEGLPYVVNRHGNLQTIEVIDFHTKQLGLVRILPNFVADGSSRPFDRDKGSNKAALLHDALYRGAPQLTFPDGYPGRWSKPDADAAYCQQLKIQGASKHVAKSNCHAIMYLPASRAVWDFHRKRRESYWSGKES